MISHLRGKSIPINTIAVSSDIDVAKASVAAMITNIDERYSFLDKETVLKLLTKDISWCFACLERLEDDADNELSRKATNWRLKLLESAIFLRDAEQNKLMTKERIMAPLRRYLRMLFHELDRERKTR